MSADDQNLGHEISGTDQCPGCHEAVTKRHQHRVQCDSKFHDNDGNEIPNHWWHSKCLVKSHLLEGEQIQFTPALFKLTYGKDFQFSCHLCDPGSSPWPIQLVEQGTLSLGELQSALGTISQTVFDRLSRTSLTPDEIREYAVKLGLTPDKAIIRERGKDFQNVNSRGGEGHPSTESDGDTSRMFIDGQRPPDNQENLPETDDNESIANSDHEESTHQTQNGINQTSAPSGSVTNPMDALFAQFMQTQNDILTKQQNMFCQLLEQQAQQNSRQLHHQSELAAKREREQTERNNEQLRQQTKLLETAINQNKAPVAPNHSCSAGSQANKPLSLMKKIDIPKFSGNVLDWPSFWDLFTQLYGKHESISNVEKMGVLLEKLEGPAKRAVANFKITDQNYQLMVDTLKERYDDKRKIKHAHIQALQSLQGVSTNSASQLQAFLDDVNSHARVLLSINDDDVHTLDLQCSTIIPQLFEKLPMLIRSQMLESCGRDVRELLSLFRRALQARVEHQWLVQGDNQSKFSVTPKSDSCHKPSGASLVGSESEKEEDSGYENSQNEDQLHCIFCDAKNDHQAYECPQYTSLDSRKKQLGKSCHICLEETHFARDCPQRGQSRCVQCHSSWHNLCLCPLSCEKPKKERGSVNMPSNQDSSSFQGLTFVKSDARKVVTLVVPVSKSLDKERQIFKEPVVMQTANVPVRNPENSGIEIKARTLLDSGSEYSYITHKFAEKIGLCPKMNQVMEVKTFGSDVSAKVNAGITDIEIQDCHSSFNRFKVKVIETVTGSLRMNGFTLSADDEKVVTKLDMADPWLSRNRPFQIELLIGNDLYAHFLKEKKIQLGKSGVYLLETSLGWVGSGIIKEEARLQSAHQSSSDASLENLAFLESTSIIIKESEHSGGSALTNQVEINGSVPPQSRTALLAKNSIGHQEKLEPKRPERGPLKSLVGGGPDSGSRNPGQLVAVSARDPKIITERTAGTNIFKKGFKDSVMPSIHQESVSQAFTSHPVINVRGRKGARFKWFKSRRPRILPQRKCPVNAPFSNHCQSHRSDGEVPGSFYGPVGPPRPRALPKSAERNQCPAAPWRARFQDHGDISESSQSVVIRTQTGGGECRGSHE